MTTVDFSYNQRRAVGQQYVYLKQKWQDDWTLYYDVHCSEATWCLSPSIPTATLVREYGYIKGLGTTTYTTTAKLDLIGWYVKVVMETDIIAGESNTWYGVVSHVDDEHRGIVTYGDVPLATGLQVLSCYGLEKLLDTEYLSESWVDTGNAFPMVVQLPIEFNSGGRPNRSSRRIPPGNSWTFEGQALTPGGTLRPTALWWSTRDIVEYLLAWAVPKESFRTRTSRVPFKMYGSWFLPLLDRPVIEQEGQTVLSLLDRLIDRRRLRSFLTDVDTTVTPHAVRVNIRPWNASVIDTGIANTDILQGNLQQINLVYDYSQNTTAILRASRTQRYDRIVVRGARRTSTATFHADASYLANAWTDAEETAYEAAASGVTGYAGWDTPKQMQRNAEVRNSETLSAVYSWFKLPDTWSLQTIGTETTIVSPVFVQDDATTIQQQYIHDVVWEPFIPFYEHVDYSGTKIGSETVAAPPLFVYRQPLVVFKIPTDARWIAGDAVATLAESTGDATDDGKNFRWSAAVRTQPETRTIEVRVSGEQQHVIAGAAFTKLDADRALGDFTYQNKLMAVTATLRDNRYAEGKYPADGHFDSTLLDTQFGYVIYAGDSFRQDYVVPGTVVDVASDGTLVTSTGGFVRDDTDVLKALARITFEWWSKDRMVLTLSTTQLTSKIQPGYFITTVGNSTIPGNEHYEAVNTVVSELRISWPKLEGNQQGTPTLQLTTGAGELDAMTLAPRTRKCSPVRRRGLPDERASPRQIAVAAGCGPRAAGGSARNHAATRVRDADGPAAQRQVVGAPRSTRRLERQRPSGGCRPAEHIRNGYEPRRLAVRSDRRFRGPSGE